MAFFKEQKKPNSKKNTFQNYNDHFDFLQEKFVKIYEQFRVKLSHNDFNGAMFILNNELLARLSLLEPLRDRYDYLDEAGGATVIPLLCKAATIGMTAWALWESMQVLAIKIGAKKNDGESHGDQAATALLLAGLSMLVGVASFIKSVLSLAIRPLVTALEGWKKQDEVRFHNQTALTA